MRMMAGFLFLTTVVSLPGLAPAQQRFARLTGWGGGKPEEICPKAAAIGFNEIFVWNRDPAYLRRLIDVASPLNIDIYASVYLSDVATWKKRFPDSPPPLQVMGPEEDAALQRIEADKSPGKGQYQFGGEPVGGLEVLTSEMLCFHRPEVVAFLKDEIKAVLAVEGLKGIAFDFFGYRNYRCCRCEHSTRLLQAYATAKGLSQEAALEQFSLGSLVDFNNDLAAYARSIRPEIKVATHVYPVFLPEPLYGNRLDVDFCGQTGAWYFDPFWSLDKIRNYSHVISAEAKKYHPHSEGVALIGIHNDAKKYGKAKTPDRIAAELQAILDGGCRRVQVCSMGAVLADEKIAAVFKEFFGAK